MKDEDHDKKIQVLLEKFKIAATIQDNYNNLFWYRTSVFFAIISVLFAGYGLTATEILKHDSLPPEVTPLILMLMIFGVIGALLSWFWLQIHKRATFLQEYYRFRASVIEKSIEKSIGIELEIPEIFGSSYRIASEDKASEMESKEVWMKIYGTEGSKKREDWKTMFKDLVGEEWENQKKGDAGSLRNRLKHVYWVFIGVWISLSLLGVVILILKNTLFS